MSAIRDLGKYKIFIPDADDIAWAEKIIAKAKALNSEYLSANPVPEPEMKISGTFICGHAPNYDFINMTGAGVKEWDELFLRLRSYGADTVLFQSALWAELNECYYRSRAFADMRQFNTIEPMLESAEKNGMDVFLGGYGSAAGWAPEMSARELSDEINKHKICLYELLKLGKVKGFYFPCETAFEGKRDQAKEQRMRRIYKEFCDTVKEIDPDALVICSPATKVFDDMDNDFTDAWEAMLDGVAMDILMPQDSVGANCCPLAKQRQMWHLWRRVADSSGKKLWANVELFNRTSYTAADGLGAVPLERLKHQIANVTPFAEKLCSWEMVSFPLLSEELHRFLQSGGKISK